MGTAAETLQTRLREQRREIRANVSFQKTMSGDQNAIQRDEIITQKSTQKSFSPYQTEASTNINQKTSVTKLNRPVSLTTQNFHSPFIYQPDTSSSFEFRSKSLEFDLAQEIINYIVKHFEDFKVNSILLKDQQFVDAESGMANKIQGLIYCLTLLTVLPAEDKLISTLTANSFSGIERLLINHLPQNPELKLKVISVLTNEIRKYLPIRTKALNDQILKSLDSLNNRITALNQKQDNFTPQFVTAGLSAEIKAAFNQSSMWGDVFHSPQSTHQYFQSLFEAIIGDTVAVNAYQNNSYLFLNLSQLMRRVLSENSQNYDNLPRIFDLLCKNIWNEQIIPALSKNNSSPEALKSAQFIYAQNFNYFTQQLHAFVAQVKKSQERRAKLSQLESQFAL